MEAISRRTFGKQAALLAVATAAITLPELEGCSLSSWLTTVEGDLPEILNIITSILAVVTAATGSGTIATDVTAKVDAAVKTFQALLTTLQSSVAAYSANKSAGNLAALIAALQAAQAGVPNVISTISLITSPTVATVIVAGFGTAITILSAIEALVPGAAPAAMKAAAAQLQSTASNKIQLPNKETLRTSFNAVLILHGYAQFQIVK